MPNIFHPNLKIAAILEFQRWIQKLNFSEVGRSLIKKRKIETSSKIEFYIRKTVYRLQQLIFDLTLSPNVYSKILYFE